MAERDLVHQPSDEQCGLETAGRPYDPPLLPYEIALIETLGCTEQEYREFVRHAQLKARIRPAEYEHIPDIVNDPISIVVSLVIGLAFTAVSVLLAPKVPTLEPPNSSTKKIRGQKLADQIGPSSFNQTTSFDNVSSLAEYGQPIPIPFGKKDIGADGLATGGLSLSPALVWSRVYSHGSYQSYEGIYVVGEYGLNSPSMPGVRIGTYALDSLGDKEYAVLWKSQAGDNFPTDVVGGTIGPGATGSAGKSLGQIFYAPDAVTQYARSASIAYNPQSQTQFGTATPIHNGTAFRFNWEIISAPELSTFGADNIETRLETRANRRKIAGADADVLHLYPDQPPGDAEKVGQPGVGRAYSRRMGLVAHNGTYYADRTIVNVSPNDTVIFEINGTNWEEFENSDFTYLGYKTEVNLKDLQTSATAWRDRASNLLTVGSRWIISGSIWIVESRSPGGIWQPGTTISVTLRCVSIVGVATVGIAGTKTVQEPLGGYNGKEYNELKHCGAGFFTLTRLYMSSIRPVRQNCVAIEFGIKSQVWNRASGLCNFNAIPTPNKLYKLDQANITLTTPRMDKYFARTSCFSVMVRIVAEYGQPENPWHRIPELFAVTGTAPIDQYNYLRIKPKVKAKYEYRFIPRPGSDIAQNSINENVGIRLDSQNGTEFGQDYSTPIGDFRVTTTGSQFYIANIEANAELITDATSSTIAPPTPLPIPAAVSISNTSSNTGNNEFIINSWTTHYLGVAWGAPGQVKTTTIKMIKDADPTKTLTITMSAQSLPASVGPKYLALSGGSPYKWENISFQVVSATGSWNVGDTIKDNPSVSNVFSNSAGYSKVAIQFQASAVQIQPPGSPIAVSAEARVFEQQSQIADCSHFQELQKSNESGPEHEIVYINEFVENETVPSYENMSTVGLCIKSSGQVNSVEQMRIFSPEGIKVNTPTSGYTASNLFADLVYYLLTSKPQGAGNTVPAELIDTSSIVLTGNFLKANKIFFDGVIEDSENLRSFIYDTAALQLCNFTIKNGRFGLMPALPYDSSYKISTQPVAVDQIFTAGNIIEDSLQVQYIDAAQRSNFRALVSWRVTVENDLPSQASALVSWKDIYEGSGGIVQQTFDLTRFCTNRAQALLTARFLLSVRRRITHTISFKTVPDSLGIQPGSYIRVITSATTYNASANGVIQDSGTLVSISTVEDGTYTAMIYNPTTSDISEKEITVSGGSVTDPTVYGTLFTLLSTKVSKNVYQVEQLNLDEDGLVNISAVEVPVDSTGASIVAKDVFNESAFDVLE